MVIKVNHGMDRLQNDAHYLLHSVVQQDSCDGNNLHCTDDCVINDYDNVNNDNGRRKWDAVVLIFRQ